MSWIEYHTALRDHWKIQRLADSLNVHYCHALGAVSCLWLWCVENSPKGEINKFTDAEICNAMRLKSDFEVKKMLKNCELIDELERINDWHKHGIKYLKSTRNRMKQYRNRLRNRNVTVTATNQPNQPTNQPNKRSSASHKTTDDEFFAGIKKNYDYVDLQTELKKMDGWLLSHPGRTKTRRFIINWLNKIDKPIKTYKQEVKPQKSFQSRQFEQWEKEAKEQEAKLCKTA